MTLVVVVVVELVVHLSLCACVFHCCCHCCRLGRLTPLVVAIVIVCHYCDSKVILCPCADVPLFSPLNTPSTEFLGDGLTPSLHSLFSRPSDPEDPTRNKRRAVLRTPAQSQLDLCDIFKKTFLRWSHTFLQNFRKSKDIAEGSPPPPKLF